VVAVVVVIVSGEERRGEKTNGRLRRREGPSAVPEARLYASRSYVLLAKRKREREISINPPAHTRETTR
jgi:hypothetical protein